MAWIMALDHFHDPLRMRIPFWDVRDDDGRWSCQNRDKRVRSVCIKTQPSEHSLASMMWLPIPV